MRPLFRRCTALLAARSPLGRKRGTRKSGLETKTENEARSALLARLWCHLPLQNPANRAENLTRLCSATMYRTGWRMVQFGAIRSRLAAINNREKQGINRCLRCLLLVMCTYPFARKALTLHLARGEGRERYFGCNLMQRKVLASSYQHLMAEAPRAPSIAGPGG